MKKQDKFASYLVKTQQFEASIVGCATARMEEYGENSPGALARILIDEYGLDHDTIYCALARHYAFGVLNLDVEALDQRQIFRISQIHEKINEDFLRQLFQRKIVPFRQTGRSRDVLQVIASNPTDSLIHEIEARTSYKQTEVYWCPVHVIDSLIKKVSNTQNSVLKLIEEAPQSIINNNDYEDDVDEHAVEEEINKSLLVNLFETVLIEAVRHDASDVHIVPGGKFSVDLYLRIDGNLQLWHHQENTPPEALAAVIKDRSMGIDRFERDTAQDGYAQRMIDNYLIRFRVSVLPIVSAEFERRFESIVIRIIDDRKVITDFHKLGFQSQAEREFTKSINTSRGIVIVTGPTGSGKSTTLMAALSHIINPKRNVLTCEDPVEYVIKGARQLKIGHKMSFEQAMRSILRHDPDVVMVGEIRDRITADIAVKLANTGHLTLSTLHTNDATSAITRLYKMGVEPFLLAYSINIIIAQRLVRKLCDHCKQALSPEMYPAALELGLSEADLETGKICQPVGCSECNEGYRGRINIAEALYFYPEIRSEIIRCANEIDEDRLRSIAESKGMLSMRASGIDRIRNGLTSIAEVIYATSEE